MSDKPNRVTPPADPELGSCEFSRSLGLVSVATAHSTHLRTVQTEGVDEPVNLTEAPVEDHSESVPVPVALGEDPLTSILVDQESLKAGDRGVEVRQNVADARNTLEKLQSDNLFRIEVAASDFKADGKESAHSNFVRALDDAIQTGMRKLQDVHDTGLEISSDFKSGSSDASDQLERSASANRLIQPIVVETTNEVKLMMTGFGEARSEIELRLNEAYEDFLEIYTPVANQVADYLRWDYTDAGKFKARLEAMNKGARSDAASAKLSVAALKVEMTKFYEMQDAIYRRQVELFNEKIAEVNQQLEVIRKKRGILFIDGKLTDGERALTHPKIMAASRLAESGKNLKAVRAAMALIDEAIRELREIGSDTAKQESKDSDALLKATIKVLNTSKYSDRRSDDHDASQKLYDTAKKDVAATTPPRGLALAREVHGKVVSTGSTWGTYEDRAKTQLKWDTDFQVHWDTISRRIGNLDEHFRPNKYKGTLINELQAAKDALKLEEPETNRDAVMQRVNAMKAKLTEYEKVADLDADTGDDATKQARAELKQDQKAAVDGEEALEKAKREFKTRHDDLKERVETFRGNRVYAFFFGDKEKTKEVSQILSQISNAKNTVDKSNDVPTGEALLKRAETRLKLLQDQASGITRTTLGAIGTEWKRALTVFSQNTAKLGNAILRAAEDEGGDEDAVAARNRQIKAATDGMADLVSFYDRAAFDAPAAVLGAEDASAKDRKRAREEILRRVHVYMDYTKSNPMMKAVVGNPFGEAGIATVLFGALRKIELEVLRNE